MENNKENIEIIETSAEVITEEEKSSSFKDFLSKIGNLFKKIANIFKSDKIKNENLFKKGGYSLIITALVLAALIVVNWLMSALSARFNLEFDMTTDKKNSMSEENIEYIKGLDADVTVTICGAEKNFADYMMSYAQQLYGITISTTAEAEYFDQTVKLIAKYPAYNDRITVKYVDMQSTEFTAISTTHSDKKLNFGDMLVTSNASERVKHLQFTDIYAISEGDSSSSYYYSSYSVTANRVETALTSAIAYVTSTDTKKVAVLSGHSSNDYTEAYKELLGANNYEITEISDKLVSEISNEFDAIIISAPTTDFVDTEIDVISAFLENDGKLGKGLVYFADATCPSLPNLNSLLTQWGVEVGTGLLFETYSSNHIQGSPSTMGVYPVELEDDDITSGMGYAIANYLVPMNVCEPSSSSITATALMQTLETTVVAPVGAAADWADYTDDDLKQFDCVIMSEQSKYDDDNNLLSSYVMAFSSVEFIQSTWASYLDLCNQDIVLACTDRAAHVDDTTITFTSKVISEESFSADLTQSKVTAVRVIFMILIPIVIIALGIAVFVRRRNAQ
ncbi:MAG: GldG family protein [Clostridia bacterium]|nr:GldG family protein [Clostridia bacterium]